MTKEDKREILDMLLDIIECTRWSDGIIADQSAAKALNAFIYTIFKYRAELIYGDKETEDD